MFPHLFITNCDITQKKKEGEKLVTQESVRMKLQEKTEAVRQRNISDSTGIPREIISKFLSGKRDLYPESLSILNEYLDNH